MAKRDSSLDLKIENAARSEFLALGYEKASLHEIARKAGVTTGALYTRYDGKEGLFESLLGGLFNELMESGKEGAEAYGKAEADKDIEEITAAIGNECDIYRKLLDTHYDECRLLMCKSHGSRVERMLKESMEEKCRQTSEFFERLAGKPIDRDSITIILMSQFEQFRCILERNWPVEKVVEALKLAEVYQEAGWKGLLKTIM